MTAPQAMKYPALVGHRGTMHACPENTLTSVKAALDVGARFVEFDVQMSGDGVLIIIHDDNTKRTSDTARSVFDTSYDELKKISVHYPDKFSQQFHPQPIATLDQMMQLVADYPDARAMVEIKEESIDRWGLDVVMSSLVAELEPYEKQSVIISFSSAAMDYVKASSDFLTGWVLTHFDRATLDKAKTMKPDYLICNYKKINNELWKGDWQWMLYDITELALIHEWYQAGADLIETAEIGDLIKQL